ncbi:gliding motility-associated C-terminal domain-containing protein [Aurantibacillus circumpalustris]|uniref:gliding motility-associated C-terminal domain-containing protein n=1 Tax=Aurantibacillus circumpalustris TaxID=3036359 RepID=UPI00295BD703|nr:gliding motility-associated C-terminal domain-containing protein [Aurantibacillus circumpalustris]
MKKILLLTAIAANSAVFAQSPIISPQVINSAGNERQIGTTGIYITDNIGEPFTEMIGSGSLYITQGYIQPEVITIGGFTANVNVNHVSCDDKQDGEIIVRVLKPLQVANYQVTYSWSPTSTCTANCDSIVNLTAQTYTVKILITYTNNIGTTKTDSLTKVVPVLSTGGPCLVKVYHGITANNDGDNDVFTVDHIEDFPKNRLLIFSRWGQQLADITGYDNNSRSWPSKDKLDNLLPSTYFYILDLGDGSKPMKGWVELIKN